MKTAWRRTAALLLCLTLLLAGCAAREEEPSVPKGAEAPSAAPAVAAPDPAETGAPSGPTLSLWLTEDDPLCGALEALAEEYMRANPGLSLSLRRVSGAQELDRCPEEDWPDLLLCGEEAAAALLARGKLGAIAYPDEPAPLFRTVPGVAESGYFPFGAELPVLLLKEENRALLDGCDSLEALCAAASAWARGHESPFFSVDSFAQLFACALAQKDCPFYGLREQDRENESYRELYNLLADAAFEGGLVLPDGPVSGAVERGLLICGVCGSRALAGLDREGFAVLPLPPLAGCEPLVEAKLSGLALLPGADKEAAARLIAWLYAGDRAAQAAMEAGLAPAQGGENAAADAVAAGLLAAAETGRWYCPPGDGGYHKNGAAFEQSFRAALALLG